VKDKPLWRRTYDAIDTTLAPRMTTLVHSSQFASATAAAAATRRRVGGQVDAITALVLHLLNLPARSDIDRLRRQIGMLDREVRRLSADFDQGIAKGSGP
jgi:hypothetical protein